MNTNSSGTTGTASSSAPLRLHLNEPTSSTADVALYYPDLDPLTVALARLHGVSPDSILVTPGADGAIDAACRAAKDSAVLLEPDFPRYSQHAKNAKLSINYVSLADLPAAFPTSEMLAVLDSETGLVLLATVGNPTGYRLSEQDVLDEIRQRAPAALVAVDEVYSPFVGVDFARYAAQTPGVISIRSLSKVGFPGLRVGYVVAQPATLARLRPFVSPFAVSGPSVAAALDAVRDRDSWTTVVQCQIGAKTWLAQQLTDRGIVVFPSPGNWVLARLGQAVRPVVDALASRGVLIQIPDHPRLTGFVRVSTPDPPSVQRFVEVLDDLLEPPFETTNGLLHYKQQYTSPEQLAIASFVVRLFDDIVLVDHYVVTLTSRDELDAFADGLHACGGVITEGPGLWPDDFCSEGESFPLDLAMHFLAIQLPSGGIIVLSAPHQSGDQIDRFRRQRGAAAIHHVAVKVEDVYSASAAWQQKGFPPLSALPLDDGSLQQWFHRNPAGQIVELIRRQEGVGAATFSCANLSGLRMSEGKS